VKKKSHTEETTVPPKRPRPGTNVVVRQEHEKLAKKAKKETREEGKSKDGKKKKGGIKRK